MDLTLAKSLYLYAKGNADKIAQLEEWRDAALTAIVEGKGQTVSSTSGNGLAVTFSSNGLTIQEWFNTLTQALQYLEKGLGTSKIQGYIV